MVIRMAWLDNQNKKYQWLDVFFIVKKGNEVEIITVMWLL